MTSTALTASIEIADLDERALLGELEATEELIAQAEVHRLRLVQQWAIAHPATGDTAVLTHDETPGGAGTPAVAAFTAEPLGLALRVSTDAAQSLIADTLDLVHRLPRVWDQVQALLLPVWKARRIARLTRSLSPSAAAWVDRQTIGRAGDLGPAALDRLIATAVARVDPDALAEAEASARAGWDVELRHPESAPAGTSELHATGDTFDLIRFHDLVCAEAETLADLGDQAPIGERKARALGQIADRGLQEALPLGHDPAGSDDVRRAAVRRRTAKVRLYLHASLADLLAQAEGARVGTVEGLGPVTLANIRRWVAHAQVTVVPVLDLADDPHVDRHDPPPRTRETVVLRDQRCVFPWCDRPARCGDLDHVTEYDDTGPPGQTRPSRLAPLCRRHHRAKTSRTWTYTREPDGSYLWTSPHGLLTLVTPRGTIVIT